MSLKRLELGAGHKPQPGYIHMDAKKLPHMELVGDIRRIPMPDFSFDEVYAHWVLEHFAYQEIPDVLKEWRRVLKVGGLLHLVTNNGAAHLKAFREGIINIHELNWMLFGLGLENKKGGGYSIEDLHKTIWTKGLVKHFFEPLFAKVEIEETWKHRGSDGKLKCPGIIIKAYR